MAAFAKRPSIQPPHEASQLYVLVAVKGLHSSGINMGPAVTLSNTEQSITADSECGDHTCNSRTWEGRGKEDQEFRTRLSGRVSLRSAWCWSPPTPSSQGCRKDCYTEVCWRQWE